MREVKAIGKASLKSDLVSEIKSETEGNISGCGRED